MNLRQAAQQALEAMDKATRFMSDSDYKKLNGAIDTLREALAEPPCKTGASCTNKCQRCAEPEQEPVFWFRPSSDWEYAAPIHNDRLDAVQKTSGAWVPLYTAPTPRNEPVIDKTMAKRIATQLGWRRPRPPLTDEEIALISVACAATHRHDDFSFARAIERAHGIKEQET